MKKISVVIVLLLFIVMSFLSSYLIISYFDAKTKKEYKSLMKIASEKIITEENYVKVNNRKETSNTIGILEIESINLKAPVQEGTTKEILKYSVGHFEESSMWNGNIALASHNRGSYAKYFENINKLENGDMIKYKTVNRRKKIYGL